MWTCYLFFLFLGLSSGFAEKIIASTSQQKHKKNKGDPGLLLEGREGGNLIRPGRDTYRYYGTGAKGICVIL